MELELDEINQKRSLYSIYYQMANQILRLLPKERIKMQTMLKISKIMEALSRMLRIPNRNQIKKERLVNING